MKAKIVVTALATFAALALAACGGPDVSPANDNTPSANPATAKTSSLQPAPSTSPQPEPVSTDEPTAALAPETTPTPVTFGCGDPSLYQSGTALYSDGTSGYEAACDFPPQATAQKILWYCDYPQTAVYTDGTSSGSDPACIHDEPSNPNPGGGYPYIASEDLNGDGVVHGYERCGLACGEEPTSGDIQTQHGCEQGYITGTLCERYN